MGLNHQDLELMMRGIAAPGDAAMQVRQEQDRRQAQGIEQELRQKMLEQEIRRTGAEEGRNKLLGQKAGEDADQNVLKDMISVNPYLTDDSRAQANKYLSSHPKWGAVGIQLAPPVKKPVPQAGQSAGVAEMVKAREFRDKAAALGPEGDLDTQKWYIKAAETLEKRAESAKADPSQFLEQTTTQKPGLPGQPPETTVSTRQKIPVGTVQPAPAAGAQVAPAPKDPTQRVKGQRYQTPRGTYLWTGDGWSQ